MIDIDLLRDAIPSLMAGARLTVFIAAFGILIGLPLGIAVGILRSSRRPRLKQLIRVADAYSTLFRGTPMLVQLFVIYYGSAQIPFVHDSPFLWWLLRDAIRCAILAVVLNTTAYTSEIFRSALLAVPSNVIEAAEACGLSRTHILRLIRLPLAIRQALPAYSNEAVIIVKETSLASTITVLEITGYAKRLMSSTFAIIEIFILAAVFYFLINYAVLLLLNLFEKRLAIPSR